MRVFKWAAIALLLSAPLFGQTEYEISELPGRGTLAGTDLYECEVASTGSYKCTLVQMGTWILANPVATANPIIAFKDSDATDGDDNGTIDVDCTDTGSGTEDCDMDLRVQVAGVSTSFLLINADGVGNTLLTVPNSSIGPDEIMATGQVDGYFLQYESTGDTLQWAVGSGGAFDDSSDPVVMNTTTKDVHFGDAAGTLAGKVEIGGDADQPQLVIEGYSTQTDSILVVQNDADTEVFTVDNDGTTTIAGSTSTITGSGTYVEIDNVLYITPAATPPIACTTNAGIMYHDSSGVICICDGASAWVEVVDYSGTGACS